MYKVYILKFDECIPYEDWSFIHATFIGKPSHKELYEVVKETIDFDKLLEGVWWESVEGGCWYIEEVDATLTNSFKETL